MFIAPVYMRSMAVEKKRLCGKIAIAADILLNIIMT